MRMGGEHPKVLTPVAGVPMLLRVLDNMQDICPRPTVVVGYKKEEVIGVAGDRCEYVVQEAQTGTGSAVGVAKTMLETRPIDNLMVLSGDHPLVKKDTIQKIVSVREETNAAIAMGTVVVPEYAGDWALFSHYGRIVRDQNGQVQKIVEVKDSTPAEVAIKEVNVSCYCYRPQWLWQNIGLLKNKNVSGEYYLTDMVALALSQGEKVVATPVDYVQAMGANTPSELAIIEKHI